MGSPPHQLPNITQLGVIVSYKDLRAFDNYIVLIESSLLG